MKQLIGIFRIALMVVLMMSFDISLNPFEWKISIAEMIHGSGTAEYRDSAIVWFVMFLILGVASFYIIQSFTYIIIGNQLEGKRTGLFRFLGLVKDGIVEAVTDPYFWSSDDTSGGLNNVDRVLAYRDKKMNLMSNREAVDYMRSTGYIDMLLARPDLKRSRKALSYINNKMAVMSNEEAIDFLKGQG